MSYTVAAIVRAPRSRIWAVWIDIDGWPQWNPTINYMENTEPGPLRPGFEARIHQPGLRPAKWLVSVLDESAGLFVWFARTGGVTSTATHRAETDPATGDTRVTLNLELSGLLAPVVRIFLGNRIEHYLALELAGLKARCESR